MTTEKEEPKDEKKANELDVAEITEKIQGARGLANKNDTAAALEALLAIEKQCRLAEDMKLSNEACTALLDVLESAGDWSGLLEHIPMLTKRRGQLKSTVQVIVRRASEILDRRTSKDEQIELIKALQTVTEGKIFVEIDRARLTKRLAGILEGDGKIKEAADAMQEVAVETFGAMHRSEKIAYVLEQMRLCMDNEDYIRAQILSRKVSPKAFAPGQKEQAAGEISLQGTAIEKPAEGTPTIPELKHVYYNQMIRFHKQSNNYLEIVRSLLAIHSDLKSVPDQWQPIFKKVIWYLVLCPAYSTPEGSASDYNTLCSSVLQDPLLDDLPEHKDLLKIFMTQEVTGVTTLISRYSAEMQAQDDIFGGTEGQVRHEDFKKRVTEHNLMVIAKYYSRLSLDRLSALLSLPVDDAEESLANIVIKQAIKAKIDRLEGIVYFTPSHGPVQVLDEWADSISKLLGLVETTCQKIQKESMEHNVPILGTGV